MVYYDDQIQPRLHYPLPCPDLSAEAETPTDEVRAAVLAEIAERPNRATAPSRVLAELKRNGMHDATYAQVCGALTGL